MNQTPSSAPSIRSHRADGLKVVLTQEAETNRDETCQYYLERSEQGAHNWFRAFEGAVQSLETNPNRFAIAAENDDYSLKIQQLSFGTKQTRPTHRLLSTVEGSEVTVLTLRHLHQDRWTGPSVD